MRYQSTTGFDEDQISELLDRVRQIERAHPRPGGRPVVLDLRSQVVIVLLLARQNLAQTVVADLVGVSQPTVSRIWRPLLPILGEVLAFHGIALDEAAEKRGLLVDGTDIPTGNQATTGQINYSGKRHRQGLAVQVAADLEGTLIAVSTPVAGARHDAAGIDLVGWQTTLTEHD